MTPTSVIGAYTAATTIDGATHFMLIQPGSSSTAYRKISRNVLLGVTGQPADLTSGQGFSNKVLDNTNVITIKDQSLTLQDGGDVTRQAQFQLSSITPGQTRIYTLPDATSTIANLTSAQTFTNKTHINPVITGGSITGTTITTDAIVGQSSATNGTVYGMSITGGKISGTSITAGTIGSTALATNAVQASQLATNAITLGYTETTADFTTSSSSAIQITGQTVTVTIPSGGRRIRITAYIPKVTTAGTTTVGVSVWDGVVGSGTLLTQFNPTSGSGVVNTGAVAIAVVTPSAGSKTYNVGILSTAGNSITVNGATTGEKPFILVEAI